MAIPPIARVPILDVRLFNRRESPSPLVFKPTVIKPVLTSNRGGRLFYFVWNLIPLWVCFTWVELNGMLRSLKGFQEKQDLGSNGFL